MKKPVRINCCTVVIASRDAARVMQFMETLEGSRRIPSSLWDDRRSKEETHRRVFQRCLIEAMALRETPLHEFWKDKTTAAIVNCVADCDSWIGIETCHRALVAAFEETRPIGWLAATWAAKKEDFTIPVEVAASIAEDPRQDEYWRTAEAPVLRVKPVVHEDPRRALVPTAIMGRPDALEVLENHWLHKMPMRTGRGIPARDPMNEYGHSGVYRTIKMLKEQKVMDVQIRREVWVRQYNGLE